MEDVSEKQSGWRGSRERWLQAARTALIRHGESAVKIQLLATGLGLSRTSFYWFFKDRAALLEALLDDWDQRNSEAVIKASRADAKSLTEAALNLTRVFISGEHFDTRLDFAVRGWGIRDESVSDRVAQADIVRTNAIADMLRRHGQSGPEAENRARLIYFSEVGRVATELQESRAVRLARVPWQVEVLTGSIPSEDEMAAFYREFE
ncbi:TetR/AcrR family transcriptional regulator [Palleronia abyssalis]|uniref:HTH tetR-type domain-containing protein n=1 Tax=Palleronia abyssalis TaxID=1501240 RepID=A0A2R8BRT6_9RHOB|nr:TetR/AcrR family transcriptional regulator [Palleronia abyssalis]SPJ22852.1 hypothetical protein PAA8504_00651 [Palleronia abyssalis]